MKLTKNERQKLINRHYDLGFIARTQPQGNVKIHSGYIQLGGNGYGAFMDVYHFPKTGLHAFWLAPVINRDHVVGFWSMTTQNANKVKPIVNRSLSELYSRMSDPNMTPTTQIDARKEQQHLFDLYNDLSNGTAILKRIYLRLFVYADSLDKLREYEHDIQHDLFKFGMRPFIDEQEYDYRGMYLSLPQMEQLPNKREGKIAESYDLSGSYPFDYVSLNDPLGTYFGYTKTNGGFTFNPYDLKNNNRTRCFSLVGGNAGMGKSTFLQMLNDDAFMRGNYIRNFDVTGEYRQSTKSQNGIIIDTSAKGIRVNMFEIFPTVTNADGSINTVDSFNQNISKIKAITHIMDPNLNKGDLDLLDDCLTKFYIQRGQWTYNPRNNPDKINILNLPHVQYPTLSEFMEYLDKRKSQIDHSTNPDGGALASINKLIYAYHNMESRYSDALDGHTNIPDVQHEKVVTFDMSGIKKSSTGSQNQLFQAIFFSYLSMISAQMVMNGEKYRTLKRQHKIVDDKLGRNIDYYYINIDEAEDYFDVNYPDVVGMLANMMEEMRKNYCAITLAFPTLKDILMNQRGSAPNDKWQSYHQSIRKIFGLIQYYHFFSLPQDDVDALKDFFKRNTSVTLEQLDTLSNLDKYEVLTIIVNERSYRWHTQLTDAQLDRYQ